MTCANRRRHRTFHVRSFLMGAMILVVLSAGPTWGGEKENLLHNAGFEEALLNWSATGTVQCMVREKWHPRTGDWAFGMGNDEGPNDAYGEISQEIELPNPIVEKRVCYFTMWVLTEDNYTGNLRMELEFFDSEGRKLKEVSRSFAGMPRWEWEMETTWAPAPLGTKRIRVSCRSENMESGSGYSFIWFDDGSITVK